MNTEPISDERLAFITTNWETVLEAYGYVALAGSDFPAILARIEADGDQIATVTAERNAAVEACRAWIRWVAGEEEWLSGDPVQQAKNKRVATEMARAAIKETEEGR